MCHQCNSSAKSNKNKYHTFRYKTDHEIFKENLEREDLKLRYMSVIIVVSLVAGFCLLHKIFA